MVTSGKNKKQVDLKEVLWGNQNYAKTSQFSDISSIIIYFLPYYYSEVRDTNSS